MRIAVSLGYYYKKAPYFTTFYISFYELANAVPLLPDYEPEKLIIELPAILDATGIGFGDILVKRMELDKSEFDLKEVRGVRFIEEKGN